jgi:hypothetical protein
VGRRESRRPFPFALAFGRSELQSKHLSRVGQTRGESFLSRATDKTNPPKRRKRRAVYELARRSIHPHLREEAQVEREPKGSKSWLLVEDKVEEDSTATADCLVPGPKTKPKRPLASTTTSRSKKQASLDPHWQLLYHLSCPQTSIRTQPKLAGLESASPTPRLFAGSSFGWYGSAITIHERQGNPPRTLLTQEYKLSDEVDLDSEERLN